MELSDSKKIHPQKFPILWETKTLKKLKNFYIFSKESCFYILRNGSPEKSF